ncbi:hypothetical protein MHM86_05655 [Thalassobius sp. Cn5-15]|nr:hypothetical protein [Thalassobius sp. Cn5-15]
MPLPRIAPLPTTIKTICAAPALAALLCMTPATAAPLCDAFTSADQMPHKYRKLAPVLSGSPTDWIITADQMKTNYTPDSEAQALLARIVAAFRAQGTELAILMPPPRPLVAGQSQLEALSGGPVQYDTQAVSAEFHQMVAELRAAGALAPDLLNVATQDDALRDAYYYRHDTHWTPVGAAQSAVALAEEVVAKATAPDPQPSSATPHEGWQAADLSAFAGRDVRRPAPTSTDSFVEKGSLAKMTKNVCAKPIAPVEMPIPAFEPDNDDDTLGLLADTSDRPQILLAGSSFSNRYKKDAYRVAHAISAALGADVTNHSVSGGGAIGAIEGVVNAGLLDAPGAYDLVVWELPYTEGVTSISTLRQLLGALELRRAPQPIAVAEMEADGKTKLPLSDISPSLLTVRAPEAKLQRIKVDLRFADGTKTTLSLARRAAVPASLRSPLWTLSLAGLDGRGLKTATLRYDGSKLGTGAVVNLF